MAGAKRIEFDEIGYWSEIKLDIVTDYAKEYSKILSAKKQAKFYHLYIDAFAGSGVNISKTTGEFVLGSPLNALSVKPPFREFHLIDLDGRKVDVLKQRIGDRPDVYIYQGDCNDILLGEVFPKVKYEDFRRGLCLLDPYGLHLNWEIIRTAGHMRSLDMFLNFPIMDINRNALWKNADGIDEVDIARMNDFWGDDSWRSIAYQAVPTLFGLREEKADNDVIAEAFRERLRNVAGFGSVAKPLPMRNTKGAIVYYLFFASQRPVAHEIVTHIFNKYRHHGG